MTINEYLKETEKIKALNKEGLKKEMTKIVTKIKMEMKGKKMNGYGIIKKSEIDEWCLASLIIKCLNENQKPKKKIPFNDNILNLF